MSADSPDFMRCPMHPDVDLYVVSGTCPRCGWQRPAFEPAASLVTALRQRPAIDAPEWLTDADLVVDALIKIKVEGDSYLNPAIDLYMLIREIATERRPLSERSRVHLVHVLRRLLVEVMDISPAEVDLAVPVAAEEGDGHG